MPGSSRLVRVQWHAMGWARCVTVEGEVRWELLRELRPLMLLYSTPWPHTFITACGDVVLHVIGQGLIRKDGKAVLTLKQLQYVALWII